MCRMYFTGQKDLYMFKTRAHAWKTVVCCVSGLFSDDQGNIYIDVNISGGKGSVSANEQKPQKRKNKGCVAPNDGRAWGLCVRSMYHMDNAHTSQSSGRMFKECSQKWHADFKTDSGRFEWLPVEDRYLINMNPCFKYISSPKVLKLSLKWVGFRQISLGKEWKNFWCGCLIFKGNFSVNLQSADALSRLSFAEFHVLCLAVLLTASVGDVLIVFCHVYSPSRPLIA